MKRLKKLFKFVKNYITNDKFRLGYQRVLIRRQDERLNTELQGLPPEDRIEIRYFLNVYYFLLFIKSYLCSKQFRNKYKQHKASEKFLKEYGNDYQKETEEKMQKMREEAKFLGG